MVVCQFFLRGACKFGEKCRNEHPKGNQDRRFGGISFQQSRGGFGYTSNDRYHVNNNAGTTNNGTFFGNQSKSNFATTSSTDQYNALQLFRKELQDWDSSKLWPFSCIAAQKEQKCLSGFLDTSPEELRVEAYKCKETNNLQPYLNGVETLKNQVLTRRNQLKSYNDQQLLQEMQSATNIQQNIGTELTGGSFGSLMNPFGSTIQQSSTTGLFGSTEATKTNIFGSISHGTSNGSGLFSSSGQSVSNPFATKATPFGNNNNVGLFGQQQQSTGVFSSKPSGSGLFGSSNTSNMGGLFSSSAANTTNTGGGLFSQNSTNQTGGLFSSSTSNLPTPFGNNNTFSAQNPFISAQSTGGSQYNSSGEGLYSTSQNKSEGGLFSQSAQSSGLFGSVQPQTAATTSSTGSISNPFLVQSSQSNEQAQKIDELKNQDVIETKSIKKILPVTSEDMAKFQLAKFVVGEIPTCPPPLELC